MLSFQFLSTSLTYPATLVNLFCMWTVWIVDVNLITPEITISRRIAECHRSGTQILHRQYGQSLPTRLRHLTPAVHGRGSSEATVTPATASTIDLTERADLAISSSARLIAAGCVSGTPPDKSMSTLFHVVFLHFRDGHLRGRSTSNIHSCPHSSQCATFFIKKLIGTMYHVTVLSTTTIWHDVPDVILDFRVFWWVECYSYYPTPGRGALGGGLSPVVPQQFTFSRKHSAFIYMQCNQRMCCESGANRLLEG